MIHSFVHFQCPSRIVLVLAAPQTEKVAGVATEIDTNKERVVRAANEGKGYGDPGGGKRAGRKH